MPDKNSGFADALEILNALKWPITILIIVLVFIFVMKKELKIIFGKTKKLSVKGINMEFDADAEQNVKVQGQEKQDDRLTSPIENATKFFRMETIASYREYVKKETLYDQLGTDKERVDVLLNYAITIYIIKQFDHIYDLIFGSQIALLQFLIYKGGQELTVIEHYYNSGKQKAPEVFEDFELDQYPKFLFANSLILIDNNQKLQVTTFGIDFIKYLTETRKNIFKEY